MCNKRCSHCDKSKLYLGTSLEQMDEYHEVGDLEGVVFTDCLDAAQLKASRNEDKGLTGMTVFCEKERISSSIELEEELEVPTFLLNGIVSPSVFRAVG